jgi:uncharacterized membrane protein
VGVLCILSMCSFLLHVFYLFLALRSSQAMAEMENRQKANADRIEELMKEKEKKEKQP